MILFVSDGQPLSQQLLNGDTEKKEALQEARKEAAARQEARKEAGSGICVNM